MGVLNCHRSGCENIMCDHYSPEHGYICSQCLEELRQEALECVSVNVYTFMETPKKTIEGLNHKHALYTDIDQIFKDR